MHDAPDPFWMIVLAAVVVVILVLNDRTKKWAADKAIRKGENVPPQHRDSQTSWMVLAFLIVSFVIYLAALNNPDWVPRDVGPLTPFMDFLFKR